MIKICSSKNKKSKSKKYLQKFYKKAMQRKRQKIPPKGGK